MIYEGFTPPQQKEITEALEAFGLNEKDRRVYLALLRTGQATLTPLSRATGLPLTTVQSVLKRLQERGIVDATAKKSRHLYEARGPAVFRRLLEQQKEGFADVVPILQKLQAEPAFSAKVRVYRGDAITDIFRQAIACKKRLIYEIVSAKDFQEIIGERFHFTRRRLEQGIRLKSLRVEAQEIKKYSRQTHVRELREAKFLPRELTFRIQIMFWDDTVAFFAAKEEGLAWTVESASFREAIQQLFDLLWSVSRPMETIRE